jgi:hypothetical protein
MTGMERQKLMDSASGCLAPSPMSAGSMKGLFDIKSMFSDSITELSKSAAPPLQMNLQAFQNTTLNLINGFADVINLNATFFNTFSRMNMSLFNGTLPQANVIQNKLYKVINMDTYQVNLDMSVKFWNDFENRLMMNGNISKWFQTFKALLTQNQLNALALVLEVPIMDSVKLR